jgi:hypothetical protein
MADSTDDESTAGGDDSINRQGSHRVSDTAKATGRVGRWRCCSSGPPPPITEAVEDATEDTQAKPPELGETAVLAAGSGNDEHLADISVSSPRLQDEDAEHQQHQQRDSPAVGPRRWCGSAICAPRIEDATSGPNTGEDSFAVQERDIEAAGGLQRLGSTQPDNANQSSATIALPGADVEPTCGLEPEREPEPELELDPKQVPEPVLQSEPEQTDESVGTSLHRRTNSGVIKM